jgi:hypothetical protein
LTRSLPRAFSSNDPLPQLYRAIAELLPHQGLSLIDRTRRWSDRLLVVVALLMHWGGGESLAERFRLARACVVEMHPTRRRPGVGYNGFVDRLLRHNPRLLETLCVALRRRVVEVAGEAYRTFGFVVFGVDGTKIELARSDSNIDHFKIINKKNAGPEMMLCGLFHVATRSLWSFLHDLADGSERAMLAKMLPFLPSDSLVLADAGFVGWNTITTLLDAGHHFVIRAGANVRLLTHLCHIQTRGDIVYLWPAGQQKKGRKPIVLRMVTIRDERNRQMCLLTSVLDRERLSDDQIIELYTMRWHVEVSYRWLKVSLHGRKMLSTNAEHARLEMDWSLMSLWVLTLLGLAAGVPGRRLSLAGVLRAVREAMTQRRSRHQLRASLSRSRIDSYRRRRPKRKRHWPVKARIHRCRTPQARTATAEEIAKYQALLASAA